MQCYFKEKCYINESRLISITISKILGMKNKMLISDTV